MLDAVVLFAMFPVLRHRLQVRTFLRATILHLVSSTGQPRIAPACRARRVLHGGQHRKNIFDMIALSTGRVIALPGVSYDPSICDINTSDCPSITICCMDVWSGSKLGFIRRPSGTRLGTKV